MKSHLALVGIVAFGFAIAACETPASEEASEEMAVEHAEEGDDGHAAEYAAHAEMTDTFIEMWNTKNYDLLDGILTEDFQRVAPNQDASGLAEMKAVVQQLHETYPDLNLVVDESAYDDDVGFVHWTLTGTVAEGAPAAGQSVEVSGITMLRYRDGKISKEIVMWDPTALEAELGVIPHEAP